MGDITISTHRGDITKLEADAIVNAANSDLWMGSGVAGAIKKAGGDDIEREAVSLGPIRPGEAVMTTAGQLPAKYVIHCAGMPPGGSATYWNVKASVSAGLAIACDTNLRSVAIPAIGAGVGGLSPEESAKAIAESVVHYSKRPGSVKEIILVGLKKKMCDQFKEAVEDAIVDDQVMSLEDLREES